MSETHWSGEPPGSLDAQRIHWLFAPGSLTRQLRALGEFGIRLLDQRAGLASATDAAALRVPAGTPLWIRAVLMSVDGKPAVLARSIAAQDALARGWASLAGYGGQPLGDMLYDDPTIGRSPFECAAPDADDPLARLAQAHGLECAGLWARRSRFVREGCALLVSECFLPGFWELARAAEPVSTHAP